MVEHLTKKWWPLCSDDDDRGVIGDCLNQSGLLFHGAPRTGKTFAACELARRVITNPECRGDGRFLSMVTWGGECSSRAKECKLDGWSHKFLTEVWDADPAFIVLDDLDKLRCTEAIQSELFNLIELATANEIILLVTTNASSEALVKKFEPNLAQAILARLRNFCVPINANIKAKVVCDIPALPTEAEPGNLPVEKDGRENLYA